MWTTPSALHTCSNEILAMKAMVAAARVLLSKMMSCQSSHHDSLPSLCPTLYLHFCFAASACCVKGQL